MSAPVAKCSYSEVSSMVIHFSSRGGYLCTPLDHLNVNFFIQLHFKDVTLDQRSFALVEVFTTAVGGFLTLNQTEENEEQLACWNFVRLFEDEPKITNRSRVSGISSIEGLLNVAFLSKAVDKEEF